MEGSKLLTMIVTVTVGIIFIGALLAPVIEDTSTTEKTFTNEGMWRMKEIENGDVWTFTNSPYAWTYDDDSQTSISTSANNALLGDEWCIRASGQARGPYISGNATTLTATADEVNITFTGVGGTSEYAISGYGIYDDGEYMLTDYQKPVYVRDNSIIYATGVSTVDNVGCTIHIEGTIKDGVTITMMNNRNQSDISNAVFTNVSINAEQVNGYVNLYKLTSITADVTFDNTSSDETTSHTGSISYSSYVVPYEVTAELSQHLDAGEIALLAVLPLIAITALLLLAVRFFVGRD